MNIPTWLGKRFTVYWFTDYWKIIPLPINFPPKLSPLKLFLVALVGEKITPYLRKEHSLVNEGLHKNLITCKPVRFWTKLYIYIYTIYIYTHIYIYIIYIYSIYIIYIYIYNIYSVYIYIYIYIYCKPIFTAFLKK